MLRKVLVGRPRCEGFVEVGRHGYRFAGQGTFGRLLAGEAAITSGRDPGGSRQPLDLPEQRRDHRRANRRQGLAGAHPRRRRRFPRGF